MINNRRRILNSINTENTESIDPVIVHLVSLDNKTYSILYSTYNNGSYSNFLSLNSMEYASETVPFNLKIKASYTVGASNKEIEATVSLSGNGTYNTSYYRTGQLTSTKHYAEITLENIDSDVTISFRLVEHK